MQKNHMILNHFICIKLENILHFNDEENQRLEVSNSKTVDESGNDILKIIIFRKTMNKITVSEIL